MDSDSIQMIILIILFILSSGYFSATETAFTSLNKVRIKAEANKGDKKSQLVLTLSEKYDELISGILIGNNIVNIGASSLATILFIELFPRYGATISTIVMTIAVLIFGEISPKTIANQQPERFAKASASLINTILTLLKPFTFLFNKLTNLLTRLFKNDEEAEVSDEELLWLVEEAEETGNLSDFEKDLISAAIRFDDLELQSILTPRVDIEGIDITDDEEEIRKDFYESRYSRLIVYEDSVDNILGTLHEKDYSRYLLGFSQAQSIKDCIKEVIYVPPTMSISNLLLRMQKDQTHLAVVKDEYGGTAGIVTMEDILEELVGEIWDESDIVEEEVIELENNDYQVAGGIFLSEALELYGLTTDDADKYYTVRGYIIETLERIPEVGDYVHYNQVRFTVQSMEHNRILTARLSLEVEETTEDSPPEDDE